jgi:beta-lactamase superfamily II metal-dependent hydrolase
MHRLKNTLVTMVILAVVACSSPQEAISPVDSGVDEMDIGSRAETGTERDVSLPAPEPERSCPDEVRAPTQIVYPRQGELHYIQIGLGGLTMGESALVVGPDGTTVLIDVGNDRHPEAIVGVLADVQTRLGRAPRTLDHVILTHVHADHVDGLENLLDTVELRGNIIHRGRLDLNGGIRSQQWSKLCHTLEAHGDRERTLCQGAPAPCDGHTGAEGYLATGCDGLEAHTLDLGARARLEFIGVNGFIGGASYRELNGGYADDHNGENARSTIGLIEHGPFRLLFSGDLTGGERGDDDVERFYADRIDPYIDALGVDVLHAGHHGRRTSNSSYWLDRLTPGDGRDRNIVMGVSAAHVRSPHQEVLDNATENDRLATGRLWTTNVATFGATGPELISADGGHIVVSTFDGGTWYVVQAIGANGRLIDSRAYRSVGCP